MKVSILLNLQTTQVGGLHMPGKMENVALHNHHTDFSALALRKVQETGNQERKNKNKLFSFC